jgi:ankyrin repeat protein
MNRLVFSCIVAATVVLSACQSLSVRDKAIDYLALRDAATLGDEVLVKALLERGAPVEPLHIDAAGELTLGVAESNSPLQLAAESGHIEVVRMILKFNPWVDHRCCDSPTALGYAARGGYTAIVQMLLDAGADPNLRCGTGTALEEAIKSGNPETISVLSGVRK